MSHPLFWKELSREPVFEQGPRPIDKVTYELPDGSRSDFFIRRDTSSSVVLALTPDDQVILAKQFRPGKGAVVMDMPGGGMKKEQTPLQAAEAELLEETGYAGELEFVGTSWPDGYSSRVSHVFVAKNCKKVSEQKLDPHEFIEVVLLPFAEFRAFVRQGKMTDVDAAYLALDYLGRL